MISYKHPQTGGISLRTCSKFSALSFFSTATNLYVVYPIQMCHIIEMMQMTTNTNASKPSAVSVTTAVTIAIGIMTRNVMKPAYVKYCLNQRAPAYPQRQNGIARHDHGRTMALTMMTRSSQKKRMRRREESTVTSVTASHSCWTLSGRGVSARLVELGPAAFMEEGDDIALSKCCGCWNDVPPCCG